MNNIPSNTSVTTPPPTLTLDSAPPSPSPEGVSFPDHERAGDASPSGPEALAFFKHEEVKKLSNPPTPPDGINPASPRFDDAGPTNREQLQEFLNRYAENVTCDQADMESYRAAVAGPLHPALDDPVTIEALLILTRLLESAFPTNPTPFRFLRQLIEEPNFAATLNLMLDHYGWVPYKASRMWKLNNPTFHFWVQGWREPNAGGLPMLERIAINNGLPLLLLTAKIRRFVHGKVTCVRNTTAHGARQSRLVRKKYLLSKWPSRLQAQWDLLFKHKTEFDAAGMVRNESWRIDKNGRSRTAKSTHTQLSRFFGFLTLPKDSHDEQLRGLSFALEDLTMGLLADKDLALAFLNFQQARAEEINRGQRLIIQTISALIRPLSGFVYQLPEYGQHPYLIEKHGTDIVGPDNWQELCKKTHLKLKDKRNFLESNKYYAESCNLEKVRKILTLQNPSECLFLITEGMKADVPPSRRCKVGQAVYYRNLLLHQILSNNPLRIAHMGALTSRPDNTGQLYKSEGRYYIRLKASDFKAWSHSLSLEYNAPLPVALTPEIDAYLTIWRPLLADAGTCDFVFRPNPQNEKGTPNAPMNDNSLSVILRKISRRYISEFTHGLSGHDYRHILATSLVKNVVDGIEMASLLLHVSRQMIDNHYGHFRDSKVVGAIQDLIAKCRDLWNKINAA